MKEHFTNKQLKIRLEQFIVDELSEITFEVNSVKCNLINVDLVTLIDGVETGGYLTFRNVKEKIHMLEKRYISGQVRITIEDDSVIVNKNFRDDKLSNMVELLQIAFNAFKRENKLNNIL